MKKFRDFESAREFVRKLGLKKQQDWVDYRKSGNKPDDIPSNPNRTYKNEWIDFGDWLGNGTTRNFRSFEEAREFTRALNLKNYKEWDEYCKSGNKPYDIPYTPRKTYKNEFKGNGDWLGTETVANKNKSYRPFVDAREFAISLGLKNAKEWREYCKSGNKPYDIPSAIWKIYKNEFKGFGDFLGTETVAAQNKVYRPFKEARAFAQSLNLKNNVEWQQFIRNNKPSDLSVRPNTTYKNKGWRGWGDFLNTGNIAAKDQVYRPYAEAKEFVRKLKLKNTTEWITYVQSGNKPDDIPAAPWIIYNKWKKK